ncbi:MAG TPA: S26 family signal peptidase, partial [Kaistia sp.]|nr:S26 family signal peptidase [Kaistia sp.]
MGDNRDNSTDSRVLGAVGYVPFENFVGRAGMVFFSVDEGAQAWQFWKWPWTVRFDRLFKVI